jgi:16S rRNA (adenine1518-N6/adenine1519-N6)-dimethyltransferase
MDPAIENLIPNVPALLRAFHLHPKKGLGQNFLVDPLALRKVAEAGEIDRTTAVLEVGPGVGSLTCFLARDARRVVAVELDSDLLPPLKLVTAPFSNVSLIQGDILELDTTDLMGEDGYRVVANIPYYITSSLIRHLLEAKCKPDRLILTVQKEVANRLCSTPDEMNLLALSVQVYGNPKIVGDIPSGSFFPPPDVDSSIVRIDIHASPVIPYSQLETFFKMAKAAFSQKRKMVRNSLAAGMHWKVEQTVDLLNKAGIDSHRRAETIDLVEWRTLVKIAVEENA